MAQLRSQWRVYAWIAVSAAIMGLSYWMFFTRGFGAGAGAGE